MMKLIVTILRWWLIFCISMISLTACNEPSPDQQLAQKAMAIESHEECHLCGMIINSFSGPKGQLYEQGYDQSFKFCSTRDMFAYLLDPEHKHAIQTIYVHDMTITPWDHPDDQTYIDGRKAWYVVGHNRKGAMGPTLASFSDRNVAASFADLYGGEIYSFDQINQDLLLNMK